MKNYEDYILDRVSMEPMSGCWLWMMAPSDTGYGLVTGVGRKRLLAHRVSYETFKGPISEGLSLDHLCRVRACVNPDHLEAVTHRENCLRGISPCAISARKTHCINGHEFSGRNLYLHNGTRWCRACRNINWMRMYYQKRMVASQ